MIVAEQDRLEARKTTLERAVVRLKDYMMQGMKAADLKKVDGELYTLARRTNAPAVHIDDAAKIPADYMRTPEPPPPAPNKPQIKAAIQGGREVPGCHLESSESLLIR